MAILTIQFVTDERLMIPGTGSVGVRGALLEIGPGRPGANFRYRSPREQITHYGRQHYVLLSCSDESGDAVDHPDLNERFGDAQIVEEKDVSNAPSGDHEILRKLSMNPVEVDDTEEDVVPVVKKVSRVRKAKAEADDNNKETPKRVRKTRVRK
jgi:hypothetical protein